MQNEKAHIASYIKTEQKHSKESADVAQISSSFEITSTMINFW